MKNITILLPIYVLGENEDIMLANALSSMDNFYNDVKILIIAPTDIITTLKTFDFGQKLEIKLLENTTSSTDFCSQINLGIENCDTEWFSILEIDDEYVKPWLSSMNEYIQNYKDVDVFLPVVKDVSPDGEFLSFTNESTWAYGFTEKQGYLDNQVLLEFQNYQTSGGLYRTKVIKDEGKFKDNIKLTFPYEFLLRLTNDGINIMTVPKIGYKHVNFRENSLFWLYQNDENWKIPENEVKKWLDIAKKEYFYKNKREITEI
jgi:hypothetical protein